MRYERVERAGDLLLGIVVPLQFPSKSLRNVPRCLHAKRTEQKKKRSDFVTLVGNVPNVSVKNLTHQTTESEELPENSIFREFSPLMVRNLYRTKLPSGYRYNLYPYILFRLRLGNELQDT